MGSIKIFRRIFCLTVPKISVGGILQCSLLSGTERNWTREGGLSRFSVEIFCLTVPKIFRGTFYCCISFGYRKCLDKGGGGVSRFSVEVFLVSHCQNFP